MTRKDSGDNSVWIGQPHADQSASATSELWIGQHSGDEDILVLEPKESNPDAERMTFYSLTQFRPRVFSRSMVADRIHEVTDVDRVAEAKDLYSRRSELREELMAAQEAQRASTMADQVARRRDQTVELHRRHVEALSITYDGVRETGSGKVRRRASSCYVCGIHLDDLLGLVCVSCETVLCSCGACSCGRTSRAR
jgi:hypothetical protein